jgi:MFS family permease
VRFANSPLYWSRAEDVKEWRQPKMLYYLVTLCSVAAAVQGMDETVVNGAQLFYAPQFGIGGKSDRDVLLVGLVNSAPYLCCVLLGCWLTEPLNRFLGRRGTIFVTALLSFLTCIWQGVTNSWPHLFAARFVLGLGIGPKVGLLRLLSAERSRPRQSATVPVYAAECAPAKIRGALVMQWQTWTAFGIMLGFVFDLIFLRVGDPHGITGLKWRLMCAYTVVSFISMLTSSQAGICRSSCTYPTSSSLLLS